MKFVVFDIDCGVGKVHSLLATDHQADGIFMKNASAFERTDRCRVVVKDETVLCFFLICKNILRKVMNGHNIKFTKATLINPIQNITKKATTRRP